MSIQPLPPNVVSQIKSATAITSLNSVVCELVKNSLDAGSTKIDIAVDYVRGGCDVEDDGLGIVPSEFRENGGLGKLHHTSKLDSGNQLHGCRGAFLVSLSAMALVSITSHHHVHHSHNTLSMHKSHVVSRQTPAPAHQNLQHPAHGTRVTVQDLFGNMPVRVKQRAMAADKLRGSNRDWDSLKWNAVILLLSWPSDVALTIREVGTLQKMAIRLPSAIAQARSNALGGISISKVCSILSQASFIAPDERSSWVRVTASTDEIQVEAAISRSPSPTKNAQFISLGIRPLLTGNGPEILHDHINQLFANSTFGSEENSDGLDDTERIQRSKGGRYRSDWYENRQLKGSKKGVDRWPKFYINIHMARHWPHDLDGILDNQETGLRSVMELLQVMILEFLTQNYFRPKAVHSQPPRHGSEESLAIKLGKEEDEHRSDRTGIPLHFSSLHTPAREKSIGRKKDLSVILHPKHDPLGVQAKIPIFRKPSSQPASGFDSWPHIKQGITHTYPRIHDQKNNAEDIPAPACPENVDDASLIPTASRSANNAQHQQPLLSSGGKITRRPFAEVETDKSSIRQVLSNRRHEVTTSEAANNDMIVEWVNPFTKVKSFVNQRTGHTVAENTKKLNLEPIRPNVGQDPASCRAKYKRSPTATHDETSPWVRNILRNWDNPVFAPAETSIPKVALDGLVDTTHGILHGRHHHCSQIDINQAFKDFSYSIDAGISKDALKSAKIISQVDKKFILVKLHADNTRVAEDKRSAPDGSMLVIIDQHAADERVRIEGLMEELCTPSDSLPNSTSESGVLTTSLEKPLEFEICPQEIQLLRTHQGHFCHWGILYELPNNEGASRYNEIGKPMRKVLVWSLPPGIAARCKVDPRVLVELIRAEAWKCAEGRTTANSMATSAPLDDTPSSTRSWLHRIHDCPQGIIDMLNSRACRSSIMFNDELSTEKCVQLVRRLADCMFPFQCAHGRPSLVPLVELGRLSPHEALPGVEFDEPCGRGRSFGSAFMDWKKHLGGDPSSDDRK